jgi:hypothetical protein
MVQETIVGDLRKNGFELLSVAEPDLCSDDPTSEEIAVIRRMHELRGQGLNDVQIADTLTNSGLRPRKAAAWSSAVVGRILERPLVPAGSR